MTETQVLTLLAVIAAFGFLYSIVASRLERTPINGALVYVTAGIVCGPSAFGLIDLKIEGEAISWLAELTLAVVLFTDSANARLSVLRKFSQLPMRLLLIGLPLTIALGFGIGVAFFRELNLFEIALLATMLAPTDAALGKAVVTNESVPNSVRESLNVESGLNDGICVPVLLLFLALAAGEASGREAVSLAAQLPLKAIGLGVLVGLGLGVGGGNALRWCYRNGWVSGTWLQIPLIALALLCYALAQLLEGSGFIASFVAGMIFGAMTKHDKELVLEAAEGTGDALALMTWFLFGTVLFEHLSFDWRVLAYAAASLTVVRIVPVFLCVIGRGLRTDTKLFMGWFGPRGLASIVFAVMVSARGLSGGSILIATAIWTIVLSVVAHGLTANPLSTIYSKRVGDGDI